ncbi:hypothetical protein [Collimonas humicola]|uniref:hypothetical protein n=1 Tax=Collimonas humicola TaxID=2825886 RepID=UPI001B8C4093|nr:hypothetical protein [Collimonas humicola]
MGWYKAGKIAVTNGSKAITGNGTDFVTNVKPGFAFLGPDFQLYEIDTVVSATSATLATAYRGVTAAAADYGIFQTQGIIADLSAQVAALINNYGNIAQQFPDALNAISAAQNSAGAAQATAGAKYGKGNILGTVGQTGGAPTGAIIERGSNANGEYVRFADGTQMCTKLHLAVGDTAAFQSLPLAAAFVGNTVGVSLSFETGPNVGAAVDWYAFAATVSAHYTGGVAYLLYRGASMPVNGYVHVLAVGRWF